MASIAAIAASCLLFVAWSIRKSCTPPTVRFGAVSPCLTRGRDRRAALTDLSRVRDLPSRGAAFLPLVLTRLPTSRCSQEMNPLSFRRLDPVLHVIEFDRSMPMIGALILIKNDFAAANSGMTGFAGRRFLL